MGGKIDFSVPARLNVSMQKLLPEGADVFVSVTTANELVGVQEVGKSSSVPISIHGELERFEAMVL